MDRSQTPHSSPTDTERLQALVAQLRAAWNGATDVDLVPLLPAEGDPLRRAALLELIKADLEIRWRRKQGKPLESYVERIPELGAVDGLTVEIIIEEYRIRAQEAQPPSLSSYRERFPKQYAEIERLVRDEPTRSKLEETQAHVPTSFPAPAPTNPTPVKKVEPSPLARAQGFQAGGGYRMFKRLGRGSFAEVWNGEGPGGFPVAIKRILQPLEDDDAQRELQSLEQIKQLRHPFLLQTHAYFLVDNHLHVVMELADGTLRDRAKECQKLEQGPIPLDELLRYFRESAEALDYMHSRKLLHRDIKPHNILILHGHAKVADFGLAMLGQSQRGLFSATGSGTPAYMAPEVWRGKVGPSSDQYGLALTYAEQRLGRLPFTSKDMHGLMLDHLQNPPDLTGLPEAEQAALTRALAKDPAERFPSCKEFVAALEMALFDQLPQVSTTALRHPGESGIMMPGGSRADTGLTEGGSIGSRDRTAPMTVVAHMKRGFGLWIVPMILLTILVAGTLYFAPGLRGAAFHLAPIEPLTLGAGEAKSITVVVNGRMPDVPVQLSFTDVPAHCRINAENVVWVANNATVDFIATPDAVPGHYSIPVHASAGDVPADGVLDVTIGPSAYPLPEGWQPGPKSVVKVVQGKAYYDRIEVMRGGILVPFLLIPETRRDDPPTFYIMEDKVWVSLFKQFTESKGEANKGWPERWKEWAKNGENKEADWPILFVSALEADRCAAWMGGKLPTLKQWDKAAGRFEPDAGKGPFVAETTPDELALKRKKPATRQELPKSISRFGCRHMADNGLEWSSAAVIDDIKGVKSRDIRDLIREVEPKKLPGSWLGACRGTTHLEKEVEEFDFATLDNQWGRPYGIGNKDSPTGLRVVLDMAR